MERQAALLFFVLYEVQYCLLELFVLKGDSSLLEESSIQGDQTVFADAKNKNCVDATSNSLPSRREGCHLSHCLGIIHIT